MKYLVTHTLDIEEKQKYENMGLHCYDLRDSDFGTDIASIEKRVLVNRIGCVITNDSLTFDLDANNYIDYNTFVSNNEMVETIDELLQTKEKKLRGLLVKPEKLPQEVYINNNLGSLQKMVGGNIECTYLMNVNDIVLICNEEGKNKGMKWNRDIGHDIIAGPFLIVGNDYENGSFKSLTEKQILENKIRFDKHSITRTHNKITAIKIVNMRSRDYER